MNNNVQTTSLLTPTNQQLTAETDLVVLQACPGCKTTLPFFKEIIAEYHDSIFQCYCCDASLKAELDMAGLALKLTHESIPETNA